MIKVLQRDMILDYPDRLSVIIKIFKIQMEIKLQKPRDKNWKFLLALKIVGGPQAKAALRC